MDVKRFSEVVCPPELTNESIEEGYLNSNPYCAFVYVFQLVVSGDAEAVGEMLADAVGNALTDAVGVGDTVTAGANGHMPA